MNKIQLITDLSENSTLSKMEATECVDIIIAMLKHGIVSGEGVEVRGFGSFHRKHRKARLGINPKTEERIQIDEKFVPFFKPGKALKKAVNN